MIKRLFNKASSSIGMKRVTMNLTKNIPPRDSMPCQFNGPVTYNDFLTMAGLAEKKIKNRRLVLKVKKATVYGEIDSVTGLSTWRFSIDYNDYGRLTGAYWLESDNDDSSIPKVVADYIKEMIENPLFFYEEKKRIKSSNPEKSYVRDCPCCKSSGALIQSMNKAIWRCGRCDFCISDQMLKYELLWFCGKCGDCLNVQKGFDRRFSTWKCSVCGTNNIFRN